MRIGFKPAGGIRTAKQALAYLVLMKEELGSPWLNNSLFRLGPPAPAPSLSLVVFLAGRERERNTTLHRERKRVENAGRAHRARGADRARRGAGASTLLTDCERQLHHCAFGSYAGAHYMPLP